MGGVAQFFNKVADVPVVVPQLLFVVVDDPVVQVVVVVRPVLGQGCCAVRRQGGLCYHAAMSGLANSGSASDSVHRRFADIPVRNRDGYSQ